ncbi:MAG: hypothetical protein HC883_04840 [Bdellovibrionaceae bacterium]|nr:hypothetical protein [Pseudobdellovibrionaceae bacterium]
MIEPLFTIMTLQMVVLAQALDLREVKLEGEESRRMYEIVRQHVPFVERDRALGEEVAALRSALKNLSATKGGL